MIRVRFKIFVPLLIVVPLLTCSLPPYDEGLSLGLGTAKKMVELGAEHISVGPIWVWDFDFRDREYYFIPNKGMINDDFRSGFIARVAERFFDLSYVEYLPPDFYELWSGWGIDITNDDSNRLNFHAETIKWGPFLSFIRFDAKDYRNNQYFRIEWMPGNFDVPDVLSTGDPEGHLRSFIHSNVFGSDPAKNPTIIGSSISPRPFPNPSDEQAFLCKFDVSGLFAEVVYNTDPVIGIAAHSIIRDDLDFSFPDKLENAFYYRNLFTDISYLSYYSNTQRKYKNYSWGPGMPANLKPLVKMDRRIDAVLTTGQLLSFENNRCYVYDGEGEKEYDFLLGGLHFCYEIETDLTGIPRRYLIFTLPAWLSLHDQEDELYFNVYMFPTDRLSELQ